MSPGDPIDPLAPEPPAGAAHPGAPARPLPIVVRDLGKDLQDVISEEIALAKAEVTDTVVRALKAIALFLLAGILGLYLLSFGLETIAHALEGPLPDWAAWGIVTLFILVLMGVLALIGKRLLPTEAPGTAAREELDATKVVVTDRLAEVRQTLTTPDSEDRP